MSYYKNQPFTSPEPIFAQIKLELASYFASSAVDDNLFPTWVDDCLRKLGRSSYKIEPAVLYQDDFTSTLPPDFMAVREAWSCFPTYSVNVKNPGSLYQQITTRLDTPTDSCTIDCSNPEQINVIYKSSDYETYTYKKGCLLTPGNISKHPECGFTCLNYGASAPESFDVRGNRFYTNFRCGNVYMLYYSEELDENDNQLIPDTYRTKKFIEFYIKYKLFELLFNQVTDESYNQVQQKLMYYQKQSDEAYIIADTDNKKEDAYDKQRAIKRTLNRHNRFKISNGGTARRF